jgi:very-short-patch-repair endonuclease
MPDPVISAEARLLRQVPTAAEAALWQLVRGRAFRGLKFRRMEPVAGHMAALLCRGERLILDLRPGLPETADDILRPRAFRAQGWRVLPLTEAEVLADPAAALDRLLREAS